jgi:hypothetical protein
MYVNFGVGIATLLLPGTPPQPVIIGGLQDVSLSIKFTKKKAIGNFQWPIAIARGEGEITWKAKSIVYSGSLVSAFLTGSTTAAGTMLPVASEPATVPSVPSYTVTVAHGADFGEDLGVLDVVGGIAMTPVAAGSEAAGKYSVNAATGTYTFSAADQGRVLAISYSYHAATTGHTTTFTNQLMGAGTTVALDLFNTNPNQNKPSGWKMPATILDGLDLAMKNTDFTATDLSGEAFADGSNNILYTYSAD